MFETTFWDDFTIADAFGLNAIQDTFDRAFNEWKSDYKYLTDLVMVLNHKIWFWYKKDDSIAKMYNKLWMKADGYAVNNLTGDELNYFLEVTD